jgi:hypothetical protein
MCIPMSLRRRDQTTLNKCTFRRDLRVLLPHPIAKTKRRCRAREKGSHINFGDRGSKDSNEEATKGDKERARLSSRQQGRDRGLLGLVVREEKARSSSSSSARASPKVEADLCRACCQQGEMAQVVLMRGRWCCLC